MLREQLALSNAEKEKLKSEIQDLKAQNEALKAQLALLQAKLEIEQTNHKNTQDQFQRLKDEHAEEVHLWRTVEFRRGKRTFGNWVAFCPKCHMPVKLDFGHAGCSASCGWQSEMQAEEIKAIIKNLEENLKK